MITGIRGQCSVTQCEWCRGGQRSLRGESAMRRPGPGHRGQSATHRCQRADVRERMSPSWYTGHVTRPQQTLTSSSETHDSGGDILVTLTLSRHNKQLLRGCHCLVLLDPGHHYPPLHKSPRRLPNCPALHWRGVSSLSWPLSHRRPPPLACCSHYTGAGPLWPLEAGHCHTMDTRCRHRPDQRQRNIYKCIRDTSHITQAQSANDLSLIIVKIKFWNILQVLPFILSLREAFQKIFLFCDKCHELGEGWVSEASLSHKNHVSKSFSNHLEHFLSIFFKGGTQGLTSHL